MKCLFSYISFAWTVTDMYFYWHKTYLSGINTTISVCIKQYRGINKIVLIFSAPLVCLSSQGGVAGSTCLSRKRDKAYATLVTMMSLHIVGSWRSIGKGYSLSMMSRSQHQNHWPLTLEHLSSPKGSALEKRNDISQGSSPVQSSIQPCLHSEHYSSTNSAQKRWEFKKLWFSVKVCDMLFRINN